MIVTSHPQTCDNKVAAWGDFPRIPSQICCELTEKLLQTADKLLLIASEVLRARLHGGGCKNRALFTPWAAGNTARRHLGILQVLVEGTHSSQSRKIPPLGACPRRITHI